MSPNESSGQQPGRPVAEPTPEHAWLQRMVGEWTYEGQADCPASAGSGEPSVRVTGSETVRALGPYWIIGQAQGQMPGGDQMRSIITVGFDPDKGRFVGTFAASMMPMLWVYDGSYDPKAGILELLSQGPAMDENGQPTGKRGQFKDVVEIRSDDHRIFSGYYLNEQGQWTRMMQAEYRRKR